ncbi:hypothetical protein [Flavihumibacter fluvii]|uniref:hypothetical protein n=1 Tax=Flavihumibacter fluvii TaxID=2838157 RepID=UPI001BDF2402|nr:hypothetical protein [Flavihumibacter fluvii]ULQ52606.1 hypothetical protein KJS93_21190 [Flavihumibacter fluvii]
MNKLLTVLILLIVSSVTYAQNGNYTIDVKTAEDAIKKGAFKNNYKYIITYSQKTNASFTVTPNKDYLVFFVYDNTNHPAGIFNAHLMTPDKKLEEKYTAVPDDIGQIGAARVQRLLFTTQRKMIGGKDKLPVKLNASPAATIYIFYRNRS